MSEAHTKQDVVEGRLPDETLEQLPELIFDSFRKMLWQLEVDGRYGLKADGYHAIGYVRRTLDELREMPGHYIPLMRDHRVRDQGWLLKEPSPDTSTSDA